MLEIDIKDVEGLVIPTQAKDLDAGYDVVCTKDPVIVGELAFEDKENPQNNVYRRVDYIQYHTSVHLGLNPVDDLYSWKLSKVYFHSNLRSRSSVRNYNLVLANSMGLMDPGYTGEYLFCFKYIFQPEDFTFYVDASGALSQFLGCRVNHNKIYKKGDTIGQLEFQPTHFATFNKVKQLKETARGDKGFGSSTKK